MMLFRQTTLIIASLALLALSANTDVMVSADEAVDKEDKEDKEDEDMLAENVEEFIHEDMLGDKKDKKEEMAENVEEFIDNVLDAIDEFELPSSEDGNSTDSPSDLMESEDNLSAVVIDMECACEGDIISCSNPADEEACVCEDGETICADVAVEPMAPPAPVGPDASVTVDITVTETTDAEIDTEMMNDAGLYESGAYTTSPMVSMGISAAGIVAVALN